MMRQTGGCAVGEISTRSRFFLAGHLERVQGRHDTDLFALVTDHAHFACADAFIHADKTLVDTILRPLVDAEKDTKV